MQIHWKTQAREIAAHFIVLKFRIFVNVIISKYLLIQFNANKCLPNQTDGNKTDGFLWFFSFFFGSKSKLLLLEIQEKKIK